jgi:hypothetical protein
MMMAFVIVMLVKMYGDGAAALRDGATDVFELHSGVGNVKAVREYAVQGAEDGIAR